MYCLFIMQSFSTFKNTTVGAGTHPDFIYVCNTVENILEPTVTPFQGNQLKFPDAIFEVLIEVCFCHLQDGLCVVKISIMFG